MARSLAGSWGGQLIVLWLNFLWLQWSCFFTCLSWFELLWWVCLLWWWAQGHLVFRLHPSSQWYLSGGAQKNNNVFFVCFVWLMGKLWRWAWQRVRGWDDAAHPEAGCFENQPESYRRVLNPDLSPCSFGTSCQCCYLAVGVLAHVNCCVLLEASLQILVTQW